MHVHSVGLLKRTIFGRTGQHEQFRTTYFDHSGTSSLERCFEHAQLEEDHEADPGHDGDTTSLGWPGSALVFSLRSWGRQLGKGRLGLSAKAAAPILQLNPVYFLTV